MIKKYHVSKNLWNATIVQGAVGDNGDLINSSTRVRGEYIPVQPETQYTISCNKSIRTIYAYLNQAKVDVIYKNSLQRTTVPFRTPANCDSICVGFMNAPNTADLSPSDIEFVMLNSGSTALPYEPYGNTWNSIPYRKYGTETDTLTSLPADVIADGTNASASIKGAMNQASTPSPSSPIYPTETGDKTANLFDISNATHQTLSPDGTISTESAMDLSGFIEVNGDFTVSWTAVRTGAYMRVSTYDTNKNYIERLVALNTYTNTHYSNSHIGYIRINYENSYGLSNIMLNTGSTALPYEPYGYKIPILCGGTTTNVYLGEVQSTRQIKKLVLTGEEDWTQNTVQGRTVYYFRTGFAMPTGSYCRCSHYQGEYSLNNFVINISTNNIQIVDNRFTTLDEFKNWIASQYNSDTPVTIWFALTIPITGIVNEPIRKIGTYADSVSVSNLPPTGTAESFDIDTTLKPSEVQLTYHGWHEHQPEKYVGG